MVTVNLDIRVKRKRRKTNFAPKIKWADVKIVEAKALAFESEERIDVVVLTKNSAGFLHECLASIYDNVPVNHLIIVDGYSTDATLDIVEEFQRKHGNIKLIRTMGTRGYARQKGIEMVETDWFMFVDSDVVLCKDWYSKALRLIDDDVGAVWGMELWSVLLRSKRLLSMFERANFRVFKQRGGTHDMLVRRRAVEGIRIPANLHTYEDAYIKSWISKRGFRVVPAYDPYCIHYRPKSVWTLKGSINLIANDLTHAFKYPELFLAYSFFAFIVVQQLFAKNGLMAKFKESNSKLKVLRWAYRGSLLWSWMDR